MQAISKLFRIFEDESKKSYKLVKVNDMNVYIRKFKALLTKTKCQTEKYILLKYGLKERLQFLTLLTFLIKLSDLIR